MTNKKWIQFLIILLISAPFLLEEKVEASSSAPNGSQIANIPVEGKTEEQIRQTLENDTKIWQTGDDLVVRSNFEVFNIPRTAFTFDIDATLAELNEKTKRKLSNFFMKPKNIHVPLHIEVNQTDESVQSLRKKDYVDAETTLTDAEFVASELEDDEVNVTYRNEEDIPFEVISEVTIDSSKISDSVLNKVLHDLHGYVIPANESFTFLHDMIPDDELTYSTKEASMIASSLYELFLTSNFDIVDRHKHSFPPANSKAGLDAFVDRKKNKDLSVVNSNDIAFVLETFKQDDELVVTLNAASHGFTYEYDQEKENIGSRTLFRYSSSMLPGEERMLQEGENGISVHTSRSTYDEEGDFVEKELISHDIYGATPRIILVSTADEIEEELEEEHEGQASIEEEVIELEESINEFEEDVDMVQEKQDFSEQSNEAVDDLIKQLESMQEQQQELVKLISTLQSEMNESDKDNNQPEEEIEQSLEKTLQQLEKGLDKVEKRLDKVEERLDELEQDTEEKADDESGEKSGKKETR